MSREPLNSFSDGHNFIRRRAGRGRCLLKFRDSLLDALEVEDLTFGDAFVGAPQNRLRPRAGSFEIPSCKPVTFVHARASLLVGFEHAQNGGAGVVEPARCVFKADGRSPHIVMCSFVVFTEKECPNL